MEFTKKIVAEGHLVSCFYTTPITNEETVSGSIVTNKLNNKISFSLTRTRKGIVFQEPLENNNWFLNELVRTKESFQTEKKISAMFA